MVGYRMLSSKRRVPAATWRCGTRALSLPVLSRLRESDRAARVRSCVRAWAGLAVDVSVAIHTAPVHVRQSTPIPIRYRLRSKSGHLDRHVLGGDLE